MTELTKRKAAALTAGHDAFRPFTIGACPDRDPFARPVRDALLQAVHAVGGQEQFALGWLRGVDSTLRHDDAKEFGYRHILCEAIDILAAETVEEVERIGGELLIAVRNAARGMQSLSGWDDAGGYPYLDALADAVVVRYPKIMGTLRLAETDDHAPMMDSISD